MPHRNKRLTLTRHDFLLMNNKLNMIEFDSLKKTRNDLSNSVASPSYSTATLSKKERRSKASRSKERSSNSRVTNVGKSEQKIDKSFAVLQNSKDSPQKREADKVNTFDKLCSQYTSKKESKLRIPSDKSNLDKIYKSFVQE